MQFLGIDTSNYTTSVAIYDSGNDTIYQKKMLLPVKKGEVGLRQSDAVFHHTKQLPIKINELFSENSFSDIEAIGVSTKPRNAVDSYMPCFLAGEGTAKSISSIINKDLYTTSHQIGHILAALFSAKRMDLIDEKFIAFHVSGGTTDCLLVSHDKENILNVTPYSTSLDLKAGQAIDRVGVMLGLSFPCGKELEKLALKSDKNYKIKASMKDKDCSLSGIENKCKTMLNNNEKHEDIAKYCLLSVYEAIKSMTNYALNDLGDLPVVYAGGVMSNIILKDKLTKDFNASFATPEFSCDNAAGTALYAYLKHTRKD